MLTAILFGMAKAQVLPLAKPADEGMSFERLSRIDTVMNNHGKTMPTNAEFRIASMSKAITTTAIMTLYEQGYFC